MEEPSKNKLAWTSMCSNKEVLLSCFSIRFIWWATYPLVDLIEFLLMICVSICDNAGVWWNVDWKIKDEKCKVHCLTQMSEYFICWLAQIQALLNFWMCKNMYMWFNSMWLSHKRSTLAAMEMVRVEISMVPPFLLPQWLLECVCYTVLPMVTHFVLLSTSFYWSSLISGKYKIAGVQFGTYCFCGHSFGRSLSCLCVLSDMWF